MINVPKDKTKMALIKKSLKVKLLGLKISLSLILRPSFMIPKAKKLMRALNKMRL